MLTARHRFMLLSVFILTAALTFFSSLDFSYTVYGVTIDAVRAADPVLPVAEYRADEDNGAVVLMYHHIVPDDLIDSAANKGNNAVIGLSQFEEEMAYLADNGYTTLLMSEVDTILQSSLPFPEKSVVITFDDGYESNYTLAYPVLQEHSLKATISAVMISTVDASANRGDLQQNIPHLTFDQMREMQASGLIEFGSHSYDGHGLIPTDMQGRTGKFFVARRYIAAEGRYETQDEYKERIAQDLRLSKYVLESELGRPVGYFAYPYGASADDVREVLQQNGYSIAVTTNKGTIDSNSNALKLNRRNVDQGISLLTFAELLSVD